MRVKRDLWGRAQGVGITWQGTVVLFFAANCDGNRYVKYYNITAYYSMYRLTR